MLNLVTVAIVLSGFGFTGSVEARTKRSQRAKVEFKLQHPCPATGASKGPCKGYVIDHISPLACGGAVATQMHKLLGLLLFLGNMGNVFVL